MRELSLFAGAGGGILGGLLLGWRTVCAVELDPYCQRVLAERQNDGTLEPFPIYPDICEFDGREWAGSVDVVSGGFPCQDISTAGKGAGIDGAKSGLWKEMARIISEVRPRYVFVENSPALTSRGLGAVLGDLAALGFDAEWGVVGAHHVGAPHKRDRIWIVARHPDCDCESDQPVDDEVSGKSGMADTRRGRCGGSEALEMELSRRAEAIGRSPASDGQRVELRNESGWLCWEGRQDPAVARDDGAEKPVADASSQRQQAESDPELDPKAARTRKADQPRGGCQIHDPHGSQREGDERAQRVGAEHAHPGGAGWWQSEPDVGRVAHGIPFRVDRLKALGNAQVPIVAAVAFDLLQKRLEGWQ